LAKTTKDLGVRLTADVKDLRRKLKSLEKDWDRYGKQVQKTNKRANAGRASMGGVGGSRGRGGMGGSIIAGGAAVAGSMGLVMAAKQAKEFEEQLVDLAVTGDKGRKWIAQTRSSILKLSETWAKTPEEITAGMQAIVAATGDADLAAQSVGLLTKAAFASGAEVGELAKVANDLMGMLKIKPEGLTGVLDNLFQQANLGAVEIKDMAQWFPVVLADLENFGYAGPEAAKGIGAFFQVAKRGNTNARNTAESIKIFTQMIAQNQEKLEKLLDVKLKKNGAWLQLPDLLKTIGNGYVDMEKKGKKGLQGKFGLLVGQGKRAINPVIAAARAGFGNKVGRQSSFNELLNPTGAAGSMDRMAKARSGLSPIHKWNKAMAKLRADMHRFMLPMLERLSRLMPSIAKAASFALNNAEALFALWVSAKAAKFFSQFKGMAMAMSGAAGGGGAAAGGMRLRLPRGSRAYTAPIGPTATGAPLASRRYGFARRNKFTLGAGALGLAGAASGQGGKGADIAAMMAMGSGSPLGIAAGGAYFITKAAVSIANSEFTGTLDFAGDKEEKAYGDRAVNLATRLARQPGAGGKAGIKATPEEQAEANRLATIQTKEEAKRKGLLEQAGKGKSGKLNLADISAFRKQEAARLKGREAFAAGKFDSPFNLGTTAEDLFPTGSFDALTEAILKSDATSDKAAKATEKLFKRGIHANLSPASIKAIAEAVVTKAGKIKSK